MFFVQDYRDRIKSENPDVSFGEVGKLLGAKWKDLTPAEKKASVKLMITESEADSQPYEDQAEADKTRAAKDKAAYEGTKPKTKTSKAKVQP